MSERESKRHYPWLSVNDDGNLEADMRGTTTVEKERRLTIMQEIRETSVGPRYTVEVREQGKRLSLETIPDPFIRTTLRPRGWRAALALLRGRYELEVLVGSDPVTCNAVMELNPDYIGPAWSESRKAWNAHIHESLRDCERLP